MYCRVVLLLVAASTAWSAEKPKFDPAVVDRGRVSFKSSCGFCHGDDGTGSRAPDLIRSTILNHDVDGNLLTPVIRNGRAEKGMPAFATLRDGQVTDMVTFLHARAEQALHSANVPRDYPLAKLLTGNADQGKAYFSGAGGCMECHSTTRDLAGVATKYKPVELQQRMLFPGAFGKLTATVTTSDGRTFEGRVKHNDEFDIAILTDGGDYRSWPKDTVKVVLHDSMAAHKALMTKYTDADIHNLFAYLETFK